VVAGCVEDFHYVVSVLGSTVGACPTKNTDRNAAAARSLLQAKARWVAGELQMLVDSSR